MPEDQNQHGVKEVEPVLLNVNPLKKKIGGIAVQQGMKSIHEGVYEYPFHSKQCCVVITVRTTYCMFCGAAPFNIL
jgi:hypothetical protein